MANIDNEQTVSSVSTGDVVKASDISEHTQDSSATISSAVPNPSGAQTSTSITTDTQSNVAESNNALLQPKGSQSNATRSTSTLPHPSAPQPKRFSHFSANKAFLAKNLPTSTSSTSSSPFSSKPGGNPSRPVAQPSNSNSRLVAAKLTASPQPTVPSGWSRPSSAAPPMATGINGTQSSQANSASSHSAAPQLPTAGKVIQPQPVGYGPPTDGIGASGKPVWGNLRSSDSGNIRPNLNGRNDFPTAAEVAQGTNHVLAKKGKMEMEDPRRTQMETAHQQARMEEADTFRGVHLDPNAHHWDEMEEDDDNFLEGVIEFGDGRQYDVNAKEEPHTSPSNLAKDSRVQQIDNILHPQPSETLVSKRDRFADDFDRSWPRSSTSPASSAKESVPGSGSTSAIPITVSPLESSRVLFNERSNRLEPYTSTGPRIGHKASPAEGHSPQDASSTNVHLLQKSSDLPPRTTRGNSFHDRNRPPPPLSPRVGFTGPSKDFSNDTRGRRLSHMGPLPLPMRTPDSGRPSHNYFAPERDHQIHRFPGRPPSSAHSIRSGRHPSQSPSLSHTSLPATSPMLNLNGQTLPDLDEMRKDLMQDAAARAKLRRQQEEEERLKVQERARRKAVELEESLKAAEPEPKPTTLNASEENSTVPIDAATVHAVISEAVKSAMNDTDVADVAKSPQRRPPSLKPISRPTLEASSSVAEVSASWRSKAAPLPSSSSSRQNYSAHTPVFVPPPPSVLEQSLSENLSSDLEVVDFHEMAQFLGVSESEKAVPKEVTLVPSRPVAADFFDDAPVHKSVSSTDDQSTWRWKPSEGVPPSPRTEKHEAKIIHHKEGTEVPQPSGTIPTPVKESLSLTEAHGSSGSSKNSRSQIFYKEAAMSALDSVMSRIKGALDVMQASEHHHHLPLIPESTAEPRPSMSRVKSPQKERWIPPALRTPSFEMEPTETFDVTSTEPPRSPKAWNNYNVKIPRGCPVLEPVSKKILSQWARPYNAMRWPDLLSFDPPVEGMNRRDLSVDNVLFSRSGSKGKYRYIVQLPQSKLSKKFPISTPDISAKLNGIGAFGKPSVTGMASWRKPAESSNQQSPELDTTSRSPPPEVPSTIDSSKDNGLKSRVQLKMPTGSGVAFYKDAQVVDINSSPKSAVNFIVSSELDQKSPKRTSSPLAPSVPTSTQNQTSVNGRKFAGSTPSTPIKSETKLSSEDIASSISSPNATWTMSSLTIPAKESPSRGPDPEHLKAVWSQTSNKSEIRSINSLEGIADDLTSLPFTLQDVKSEDGETPPPSVSTAPSRMSLHDVTRAFQQVPTSNPVSHRPTISPPSTTNPVARPPPPPTQSSGYSYTPLPPNQRSQQGPYSPYLPHMMNPSPTMVFAHPMNGSPVPARMQLNGQSPIYGQPMWVPLPQSAPPGGQMIRPMSSPYGQMMPLPYSPGPPQPMYMAPIQNSPQNGARNRNSMAMMSPVMQHAIPPSMQLYPGSPVMMNATPARQPMRPDQAMHPQPSQPPQSYVYARPW